MKLSLSFGHRFSERERENCPGRPACLLPSVVFLVSTVFPAFLLAPSANSRSFVIKNGTESGHRLDNYIFHIVQIANDCCCGNLITLHLMKRQLMRPMTVCPTHTLTHTRTAKLYCSLFMTISFLKCFFFQPIPIYHLHLP